MKIRNCFVSNSSSSSFIISLPNYMNFSEDELVKVDIYNDYVRDGDNEYQRKIDYLKDLAKRENCIIRQFDVDTNWSEINPIHELKACVPGVKVIAEIFETDDF